MIKQESDRTRMNIGEVRRMIVSLVRNTILGKTKSKIYNKQGIKWKKLGKQKISYRWTSDKMHDFGRRKLQEKRDSVRRGTYQGIEQT